MSKLLKFKEYVTIEEAAKYLTKMLGEEVTVNDVTELIVGGHLTASIIANGWACYFIEEIVNEKLNATIRKVKVSGDPDDYAYGVYPISPDEIDKDNKDDEFRKSGLKLRMSNDLLASCYELADEAEPLEISRESVGLLPVPDDLAIIDMARAALETIGAWSPPPFPINALKRPSTKIDDLVIRPSDLLAFVAKANNDTLEKPLDYRERESMERIILALAKEAGLDLDEPFKAATALQHSANHHGIALPKSKDNIAGKLKAAARHDTHD